MKYKLQIIPIDLLQKYCKEVNPALQEQFDALKDAEISTPHFSFYTSVSSVFSCKIEGENIELDSYVKHKRFGIVFQPDYTKKIDDLYLAYIFAQQNPLNKANLMNAHKILGKHIVETFWQGKHRNQNMFVTTEDGRIEYVAAIPSLVDSEMEKLYNDIDTLCKTKLSIQEVFFFASLIHLVFVKIHPFNDGNGRTGRLLEKWFLAHHLSDKAWFIESEKKYYQYHQTYYNNLRVLGLEYEILDYTKALPFLLMLPNSLNKADE